MLSVEQISYYVFPHKYYCSFCNVATAIEGFGISVAGQVAVQTVCVCGRQATIYVEYDTLIHASQTKLLEKLRKGDFDESAT